MSEKKNTQLTKNAENKLVNNYNCLCMKCGGQFVSNNIQDLDGDGKCPNCSEQCRKIGDQVNKMIAERRAKRPELYKPKTQTDGVYINARSLRGL